jgi:hypothetical protein
MAYDDDLAERVRAQVASERGLDEKRMFGGLAFLVDGHMAVAVSGQGGLLLRCDPADTEELLAEDAADRFVMRGRALDGWLRVETTGLDDAALGRWVAIGVAHARSLPPK